VDADTLAQSLIALIDGYWLEQHIDPERLSQDQAKKACQQMLEPHLGPIPLAG
jgi:BetI-type transcriptional repressor, C-terminal